MTNNNRLSNLFPAEVFYTVETKQDDKSSRKKLAFPEREKTDNSESEDTTEDTTLLCLSKCQKEKVKEDRKDEESHSSYKILSNSKRNCSTLYPEKNNGKRNGGITTDIAFDDDQHYGIAKVIDNATKLPSENLTRPQITFLEFAEESLYYVCQQNYLSPKAYYIFVVNMTKGLNEQISESEKDEINCSRFESWKYQGNELSYLFTYMYRKTRLVRRRI